MKRKKSSINLHDSSGSKESDSLEMVDRISSLPDSTLGLILSCLPTQEAVATSILSKRWKFLWRTAHNLDFSHFGYLEEKFEGEDMKFVEFVNRVLLLNNATSLNKFSLSWKIKCISVHVKSWIKTAISRNVHELVLSLDNRVGPDSYPEPIEMPVSVFSCELLRSLALNGGVSISAAHVICLPKLESLKLYSVNFRSEIAFVRFISGCPMLNYLDLYMDIDYMLRYFGRQDHFTYIVRSTFLRRLVLSFDYGSQKPEDTFYCSLMLDASSLEYLKLVGFIHEIFVEKTLSSLVEADFKIKLRKVDYPSPDDCNLFVEAVRAFNCAKILTLSSDAMWGLSCATTRLSTEFKRLVKLVTRVYCFHCGPLREFIHISPNLESLEIYQCAWYQDRVHDGNWIEPVEVPRCLSNSLKKVVVEVYYGFPDERESIGYLLNNGSVLEVMKLALDHYFDGVKLDILKDVCNFPRKSPSCEVEFVVDTSVPLPAVSSSNSHSIPGSNVNVNTEQTVGGYTIEQPKKVASVTLSGK